MSERHFDVIVIGSGPGGEGAAVHVAKQGRSVALVERSTQVGGGCTHLGTIPSKAIRFAIVQMAEANKNPLFRDAGTRFSMPFPAVRKFAQSIIQRQVDLRSGFYDRNNVPVIRGHARFLTPHSIEATDTNGVKERLTADGFIIATGGRPYRPPDVDFSHPRVFDSDTILGLNATPHTMTIYGAGVVGCEYASMFRNLDVKLNLVNTRDKLLEFLDDEIIDALAYHLRDLGVLIRHREEYDHIEYHDDGVVVHFKSGKRCKSDVLLWANGRTGNSNDMGLEELGIEIDKRGQIQVDGDYRTAVPHILAVGDVIGFPALASAAFVQGRCAAAQLVGGSDVQQVRLIPTGIYTSPEISSVGKTERELTIANVPYEVGHAMFRQLARAHITGRNVGMLKMLFHRDTLEILGIHCFGENASEIVHIGQAIMAQEGSANSLLYFTNATFNYPTMAEAYRVAALNGYNRLFERHGPRSG